MISIFCIDSKMFAMYTNWIQTSKTIDGDVAVLTYDCHTYMMVYNRERIQSGRDVPHFERKAIQNFRRQI